MLGACPEIVFGLLPPTFGAALQERDGRPDLVEHIEAELSQTVDNVLQQHADALYAAHTAAAEGVARLLRDALARSPLGLPRLEAEQAEWWPHFWDQQLVSRIATELRRWAALFVTGRDCGWCMPRAGYKLDAHLPVYVPTDCSPPLCPMYGSAGRLRTCSLTPDPRTTSSCPACLGCCASRWGAPRLKGRSKSQRRVLGRVSSGWTYATVLLGNVPKSTPCQGCSSSCACPPQAQTASTREGHSQTCKA